MCSQQRALLFAFFTLYSLTFSFFSKSWCLGIVFCVMHCAIPYTGTPKYRDIVIFHNAFRLVCALFFLDAVWPARKVRRWAIQLSRLCLRSCWTRLLHPLIEQMSSRRSLFHIIGDFSSRDAYTINITDIPLDIICFVFSNIFFLSVFEVDVLLPTL